jgi:hypothetical protein
MPNVVPLEPGIGPRSELIDPGVESPILPDMMVVDSTVGACALAR